MSANLNQPTPSFRLSNEENMGTIITEDAELADNYLSKQEKGFIKSAFSARESMNSVFLADQNAPMYRPRHLDGRAPVPRSPRRRLLTVSDARRGSVISNPVKEDGSQPLPEEDDEVVVDPTHVDPYLNALSVADFQFTIFVKELILHSLMPLAVVSLIWTKPGRIYLRNRSFIGTNFVVFVQHLVFAMWLYIHLLYIFMKPRDFSLSELLLFDVLYTVRNLVVATKYGYVSPLEHKEMVEKLETEIQSRERQVISGWARPSDNSVETQLLLASVRQKLDLTFLTFNGVVQERVEDTIVLANEAAAKLKSRFAKYSTDKLGPDGSKIKQEAVLEIKESSIQKLETGQNSRQGPVELELNGWDLTKQLIKESLEIRANFRAVSVFVFIHTFTPIIVRAIQGKYWAWGDNAASYIGITCHLLCSFFLMYSNFSFILISVMDIHRREFLQKRLNAIIFDGYILKPGASNVRVRLDMNKPQNIIGWWHIKVVLQDFGLQYYRRINAYIGYFFLYAIAIVVVLVVNSLISTKLEVSMIVLGVIDMSFSLIAVAIVLSHGEEANKVRLLHGSSVSRKLLDMESARVSREMRLQQRKAVKPVTDQLNISKDILLILTQAIRQDNEAFSVKILGFKASNDLIRAASAFLISGFAAAFKILLS